jgi:hypothetical protein
MHSRERSGIRLTMQLTDITIGPNVGFLAVLNLLGAAQGVLLALALLTTKSGRQSANRLLAALTLTIAIAVSGAVLLTSNYIFAFPHLSRLHHPFVFLAAPLLFLYIRELTARERKFTRKDFLHFIPFVACLVYLLPYYLQNGHRRSRSWYQSSCSNHSDRGTTFDRRCLSLRSWCI